MERLVRGGWWEVTGGMAAVSDASSWALTHRLEVSGEGVALLERHLALLRGVHVVDRTLRVRGGHVGRGDRLGEAAGERVEALVVVETMHAARIVGLVEVARLRNELMEWYRGGGARERRMRHGCGYRRQMVAMSTAKRRCWCWQWLAPINETNVHVPPAPPAG